MKQFAAMILLILFTCTQYSRQLAYLDCKLDNISNTTKSNCDCEQQYGSSQDDDKADFPVHKNHHHFAADDYYLNETKTIAQFSLLLSVNYPALTIDFNSEECKDVFHPPKV